MGGRGQSSALAGSSRGAGTGVLEKNREAVEAYVSGEGMYINNALRETADWKNSGDRLNDNDRELIKDLDEVTNGKVQQDTLYRAVDAEVVFGAMSQSQFDGIYDALKYGSPQEAKSAADKIVGKSVTDKGFMSTTKEYDVVRDWGEFTGSSKTVVLKITNAKGAKGRDVSKVGDDPRYVSSDAKQHEVLLARNTTYTPENVYVKDGNIVVEVKIKK